jgi:mono/diheme cytochrome c family protein
MRRVPAAAAVLVLFAAVVKTQVPPADAPPSTELQQALMKEGQVIYGRDCAECHAEGGIGAALGGNAGLADKTRVITRILQGSTDGAMSAFGPSLTDREIAATATFIRNTWDNAFGAIVEADVKKVRDALAKKK